MITFFKKYSELREFELLHISTARSLGKDGVGLIVLPFDWTYLNDNPKRTPIWTFQIGPFYIYHNQLNKWLGRMQ